VADPDNCSHRHWDVAVEETSSHIKTHKKCVDCPRTWDHASATKLKPKLPKRTPRNPK
jgi:hypothetical protein